jgi:large subunit ribosomal protein L13
MPNVRTIDRKWHLIDASDKPLGRVAVQAANLLRGKHKTEFAPHVDCGDHVVIVNCSKARLTGNKSKQKLYYHHTGYIGHMKVTSSEALAEKNPTKGMELAIKGMIPRNALGRKYIVRLRLSPDENHEHEAQKPETWEF